MTRAKHPMIKFSLILKALSPIALPTYKGSTLRGGFGHAFKKVICTVRNKECSDCLLKTKCIYSYVFETPPPEDSRILRKYEKAPHPFVIEPPFETKTNYQPGDTITFGLVLIGRAVEYLPYFIYTFEELGKMGIGKGKGKYELMDVNYEGKQIYNSVDRQLKPVIHNSPSIPSYIKRGKEEIPPSDNGKLNRITPDCDLLTLNFTTPTRIVVNEDLVVDLEFHHLIRSLLRRISTLSYFHCGERLDLDFKGLIERAQSVKVKERKTEWHDWERYSARQDTRMKLGGFVGRAVFRGEFAEFMPFLKVGETLHVGKGTSFGLGKYRMES
ncbi:MAG: CRISPR system precrRNA processing endoribonuclease RAMP protein Cas6 [Deltaproteobacteria bacterium]|nr:CRISPR system precrRNA processing endoribonuclease RAMP protein Cas6 [Deltaproteobacteria bacterium]